MTTMHQRPELAAGRWCWLYDLVIWSGILIQPERRLKDLLRENAEPPNGSAGGAGFTPWKSAAVAT